MMTTGVVVHRISGGCIYFEAEEAARFNEADMRYFDTICEAVDFIKSIRSGWRYDDDGCRWIRVTRNHMTATFFQVYRTGEHGQINREQETFQLASLPEWM